MGYDTLAKVACDYKAYKELLNRCKVLSSDENYLKLVSGIKYSSFPPQDDTSMVIEWKWIKWNNSYEFEQIIYSLQEDGHYIDFISVGDDGRIEERRCEDSDCLVYAYTDIVNDMVCEKECKTRKYKISNEEDARKLIKDIQWWQ